MASEEELVAAIRELGRTVGDVEVDEPARRDALALIESAIERLADGPARPPIWSDRSTWSGRLNPVALPMSFEFGERQGQPCIVGRVRIDRLREGPAGSVHGGVVAGLFDEMMGAALRLTESGPAVTGRLSVRYRHPTPLDQDLVFLSWIADDRPLRLRIGAECLLASTRDDPQPVRTAEAEGLFVRRR